MKKILVLLTVAVLLFSLCSCGKTEDNAEQVAPDDLTGAWTTEFTWEDIMGNEENSEGITLEEAEMMVVLDRLNSEMFAAATIEFNEYYRGRMYVNEDVTEAFIEKLKTAYLDYYTSPEYIEVSYGITYEEFEAELTASGKTMEDYRQDFKASLDEDSAVAKLAEVMKDKKYNYDFAYSVLDNQIILTVIDKEMAESGEKLTKTLTMENGKLVMANDDGNDIVFEKK